MTRRRSLTNEQVREIRKLHIGYVIGYQTLAKRFGVGASTIRDVVKFYTYAGIV